MENSDSQYKKQRKVFESPLFLVLIALIFFLLLKVFFIDILLVNGHSMEPGLVPGKIIFVNRLAYGLAIPFADNYIVLWGKPKQNDIIVFKSPVDNMKLIKRCVAGEQNTIKIKDGILDIGGIGSRKIVVGNTPFFMVFEEIRVPKNNFFVLGDNSDDSIDSRFFGFVPMNKIIGRVLF